MLRLNLRSFLRHTPNVLQFVDKSIVELEGVLEDITILINPWKYTTDSIVLKTKGKLNGYLLILGRPWLATTDAYIGCRIGDMTINCGQS